MIELGDNISGYLYSCTAKKVQRKLRFNRRGQKLMLFKEVKLEGFGAGRMN